MSSPVFSCQFCPQRQEWDTPRATDAIVMDKQENTVMSNPAYGRSNVPEKWAVRVSASGEFIHQNQYTLADQGVA